MSRILKTGLVAIFLTVIMVIFTIPIAADTPRTKPPATTRPALTWYKGVVAEINTSSFTVKTGETAVTVKVDNLTLFYRYVPVEKPTVTPVKTLETPGTNTGKTGDTGNNPNSPEAQPPREKQPANTTVTATRTKTPESGSNPTVLPGTPVRFADLNAGDTVAVQAEGAPDGLVAKTVTIYSSRATDPKPSPVKLSISGKIVSVNEARMALVVEPVSGKAITLRYDKNTAFTILGSASLKAGMQVGVVYLSEAGVLTALAIKAGEMPQRVPTTTK
jgi:hypothetical protein